MYTLAIIGLVTTVMSAFYYLKIIKTIYFDDNVITFDPARNRFAQLSILLSCGILLTFFLYPSVFNGCDSLVYSKSVPFNEANLVTFRIFAALLTSSKSSILTTIFSPIIAVLSSSTSTTS